MTGISFSMRNRPLDLAYQCGRRVVHGVLGPKVSPARAIEKGNYGDIVENGVITSERSPQFPIIKRATHGFHVTKKSEIYFC